MPKSILSYLIIFGLFAGLFLIFQLALNENLVAALILAALPGILLLMTQIIKKRYAFYTFFILNYIIMGIDRYIPLKGGMVMSILAMLLMMVLLIRTPLEHLQWQRCKNLLTVLWLIWFGYCLLEILNPRSYIGAWAIAFPNYAFYPLFCTLTIPVLFTRYKNFQWLLVLWACLTILAAAKGYWQRNRGFDAAELHWLFNGEGGKTHLLSSGIRYFSFFTDAAAYGASMGISLVTFGISGFYTSVRWKKILFWIAAIGGGYGLVISGTRSDLAIPFVGLGVYILLCRSVKAMVISFIILAGSFIFLNYTTIGNSNRLIRRMRTAFDLQDASWQVRVGHRGVIYKLMQDKPTGIGLGLAGKKGERFRPESKTDPLTYMATDSWYIMTFIETGIIGLALYLTILVLILFKASMIASFKIINRELKGQLIAMTASIAGILVTCYANEILNYPNGIIVYTLMAFIFIAPYYDKEIAQNECSNS